MASGKYKVASTDDLAEEFKSKAASFSRSVRGLEDKAKKCESLKWMGIQSSTTVLSKGSDDKYFLDWQPYLNDEKRKLSRTLEKLKEIQNHRKQRRVSFIGSVKEALPSWVKKKGRGKYIQLHRVIDDTEDYEALISGIVEQIYSADELSKFDSKISQQRDSNQNDQLSKELHDLMKRWNKLNLTVINRSNRLESLGLEVDHEYKKLNEWYGKCDSFRPWLELKEKALNEVSSGPEATLPSKKQKLKSIQDQIKGIQNGKAQLQEINSEADVLLESGRLDQGDTERVEKINYSLRTRYTTIKEKLAETQSKLFSDIHQLQTKPDEKTDTPIDTHIMEIMVEPNFKSPPMITTPFDQLKDESNKRDLKRYNSMKAVKEMLEKAGNKTITEGETNRIHEESVEAFDSSLDTCEKALNEIDNESLENFSFVGSTINEIKEQLDDIQVLEQNMTQEDKKFSNLKELFDESESKDLIKEESRRRLRGKVDDLKSRWEEMWRAHDTNKNRLVQAILIMGGEWMGRVNDSLDELEEEMNSIEIPAGDVKALHEVEQRHKEIMNKIISREDSVSGAVDVAREVHRRDLVTEETGKTIKKETQALEDRLERLIGEAEDKKKRISEELRTAEQANIVEETMIPSSMISVHSAPDELQPDEGFSEPKQVSSPKKETYEALIKQKMKEFKKESKAMTEWMDETERLINLLKVDMDSKKATKIQRKINTQFAQVDEKQSTVDRIVRLSKEIENETLDPTDSEPFVKQAKVVKERWSKNRDLLENYGDDDAGSKAAGSSCCGVFLKRRLFPAWYYN